MHLQSPGSSATNLGHFLENACDGGGSTDNFAHVWDWWCFLVAGGGEVIGWSGLWAHYLFQPDGSTMQEREVDRFVDLLVIRIN